MASTSSRPLPLKPPTWTIGCFQFLYGDLGVSKQELERLTGWSARLMEKTVRDCKIRKWKGDLQVLTDIEVNAISTLFGGHEAWFGQQSDMIREVRRAVEVCLATGDLNWKVVDAVAALAHGCANREYDRLRARASREAASTQTPASKGGRSDRLG